MRRTFRGRRYFWLLLLPAVVPVAWGAATAHASDPYIDPDPIWSHFGDFILDTYGFSAVVGPMGDLNPPGNTNPDLLVGAPYHINTAGRALAGKVLLYFDTGMGLPDPTTTLPDWTVEGDDSGDLLGFSMALADINQDGAADLIVGAPQSETPEAGSGDGKVYVYFYDFATSSFSLGLTIPSPAGPGFGEHFGFSIAAVLEPDASASNPGKVIIGAPGFGAGQGMVYIYEGTGLPPPNAVQLIWSRSGYPGDHLGVSVASGDLDGDGDLSRDVIVGAHGSPGAPGTVYVWHNPASGSIGQDPSDRDWTTDGGSAGDEFGSSVAAGDFSGNGFDDLLVGAHATDGNAGQAYLWLSTGGVDPLGLSNRPADWTGSPTGSPDTHFGFAVASAGDLNGDTLEDAIIGAPAGDWDTFNVGGPNPYPGSAYLYLGTASGSGLNVCEAQVITGEHTGSFYGWNVGAASDTDLDNYNEVYVGAPKYNSPTYLIAGKLYIYSAFTGLGLPPPTPGPSLTPDWTGDNPVPSIVTHYGTSVAMEGDFNRDEFSDLFVGIPTSVDVTLPGGQGRVYGYFGGPTGPGVASIGMFGSESCLADRSTDFGFRVALDGDFNGDGYADVLVGGPEYKCYPLWGEARVFFGWDTVPLDPATWTQFGSWNRPRFGRAVASAGDVNNDGYDEVLVGAHRQAHMWLGGPSLGGPTRDWLIEHGNHRPYFGWAVASAGDVNNDCFDDIIVSDPGSGSAAGIVVVWHGSATGPHLGLGGDWIGTGGESRYGWSVSSAGDVNNDHYDDIIVGSPEWGGHRGRVLIYPGGPLGLSTTPFWTREGEAVWGRFGESVAAAGDVNGDGFDDVLVGNPGLDPSPNYYEGQAFIFAGASGLPGSEMPQASFWDVRGENDDNRFGASVAAGDVNGDTLRDVVVGAPNYDDGSGVEAGRAYVFLGQP